MKQRQQSSQKAQSLRLKRLHGIVQQSLYTRRINWSPWIWFQGPRMWCKRL